MLDSIRKLINSCMGMCIYFLALLLSPGISAREIAAIRINGNACLVQQEYSVQRLPAELEILFTESEKQSEESVPAIELNEEVLPGDKIIWRRIGTERSVLNVHLDSGDSGILTVRADPGAAPSMGALQFRVNPPIIHSRDSLLLQSPDASVIFQRPLMPGTYALTVEGWSLGDEQAALDICIDGRSQERTITLPLRATGTDMSKTIDGEQSLTFSIKTAGLHQFSIQLAKAPQAELKQLQITNAETERFLNVALNTLEASKK